MADTVPEPESPPPGLPLHVGIIMDGNGRWAAERGLPRTAGHSAGAETVRRITTHARKLGLGYLTLYAFSTENWKRPPEEVEALMTLLAQFIEAETPTMLDNNVSLRIIGDATALAPDLAERLRRATLRTAGGARLVLTLAVNYGGRDEITRAVRRLIQDGRRAEDVTEDDITAALDTAALPPPDLVIRTAGEQRLSNFLIWQAAYAELYFTPRRWPDFSEADFDAALADYAARVRKFGG